MFSLHPHGEFGGVGWAPPKWIRGAGVWQDPEDMLGRGLGCYGGYWGGRGDYRCVGVL